ncbi:radical SAM family heme chaperone HemW [Alphaproteobacteria bacterium endosymbiont of Tiliacea citrago]|uniref:radical SAM family heme chaperone HemW n=1 Tax=Alphaproteobacteria bacterium endosymbiont of Tiliacea citrago TaxID=3077944 RepID=UPI00313AC805
MNSFSLYIHWPFCIKKCPYCDFNSYAWKNDPEEWTTLLIKEIEFYSETFKNYKINTIFFGGGTPSLIPSFLIEKILNKIKEFWNIKGIEITIEINPSSIETGNLENFLKVGINRFSIGVQSLSDMDLNFLGRIHSAEEAKKIVTEASKICNNVSTDYIYTLPYDDLPKWKKDLDKILDFSLHNNIKHLSLYQLTIEENTQFAHDVRVKKWIPMNQDKQSILYRYTHKIFHKLHWNQYEISNISQSIEYESQHNLCYWNYNQYLGIGPGAHSRMIINNQKYKFNNYKNPNKWKEQINNTVEKNQFVEEYETLSLKDQTIEKMLMGFRLKKGIFLYENELNYVNKTNLQLLIDKNFIKNNNNVYTLSLNGRLKLNAILRMLIED